MPLVNSPNNEVPSVAKSVSKGRRMVPNAFLAAVTPLFRYWSWSSKAP